MAKKNGNKKNYNPVTVICYGEEEQWSSREKALAFYTEAALGSDGSERERYRNICDELRMGLTECSDGEDF